jgi:hypothetical protein
MAREIVMRTMAYQGVMLSPAFVVMKEPQNLRHVVYMAREMVMRTMAYQGDMLSPAPRTEKRLRKRVTTNSI